MEKIYLIMVDTPGFFANIIRRVIKINYVHVVLSMNKELTEAYSVGRRHPAIPIISGFEKEITKDILQVFPKARYMVTSIECSKEQKESIAEELQRMYQHRHRYHYCIAGLPFLLINKEFDQYNHYTCSSFTAHILEAHGICLFQKHFSLVTPRDFYEIESKEVIFEGLLRDYPDAQKNMVALGVAYES